MHYFSSEAGLPMLRITTEKKKGRTVLNVEGRLSGPRVPMLGQCWREMRADAPDEKFQVNLCGVTFIDAAGKILLKGMYSEGAQLLAEGCLNQAIVSEITAEQKAGGAEKRGKGPGFFFYIAFFSLVFGAKPGFAQTTAQPGSLKLTLEQSVALALKQNTTAQIAVLTAAEAEQDKNISRSNLIPNASLEVSDSARRQNIETGFGQKIPGIPEHSGPFQVFNAGVAVGTPIFDLTLWRRYQAAKELAGAQKSTSESTREQVLLLVV